MLYNAAVKSMRICGSNQGKRCSVTIGACFLLTGAIAEARRPATPGVSGVFQWTDEPHPSVRNPMPSRGFLFYLLSTFNLCLLMSRSLPG
jgi:hypothetical protein